VPLAAKLWGLPEDVYLDGTRHEWESIAGTLSHALATDAAVLSSQTSAPLVFVHGTADDAAPFAAAEALAAARGARFVALAGGHQVFLDGPSVVWAEVAALAP
jgi:pimeloyl-ACP methyl ester carboxylesterase